jgi:hypothetical protein
MENTIVWVWDSSRRNQRVNRDSKGRFREILRGPRPEGSGVCTKCGIRAQKESLLSVAKKGRIFLNHVAEKERHTNA